MSQPHTNPRSHRFINAIIVIAIGIAVAGAVNFVTYRNQQIQTAREIESTEKRITSLMQDEIPSLQAEIERQMIRYDIREKLRQNGSDLIPTPTAHLEVINVVDTSTASKNSRP